MSENTEMLTHRDLRRIGVLITTVKKIVFFLGSTDTNTNGISLEIALGNRWQRTSVRMTTMSKSEKSNNGNIGVGLR